MEGAPSKDREKHGEVRQGKEKENPDFSYGSHKIQRGGKRHKGHPKGKGSSGPQIILAPGFAKGGVVKLGIWNVIFFKLSSLIKCVVKRRDHIMDGEESKVYCCCNIDPRRKRERQGGVPDKAINRKQE